MQMITPFLFFSNQAEEAMQFYTSIFPQSSIVQVTRYGEAGPGKPGSVMSGAFLLEGQPFFALNGAPQFTFNPANSLFVSCETQEEINHFWEQMSAGGVQQQCGWLQNKFGVSWQIVPANLGPLLNDEDTAKANPVMQAML